MTRGKCLAMSETWFDRLEKAVQRDGRPLRVISVEAGLGVNYLQQLLKNRKEPGVERFLLILKALGTASALYILTGREFTKDDEAFLKVALDLSPDARQRAGDLFRSLLDQEGGATLPSGPTD